MCVPVSSLNSLKDFDEDQSRRNWPRLDWLLKTIDEYIYMLALDDYFTS